MVGNPVDHSLSPLMQNAAFRAVGLDAVYLAIPCVAEDLAALMRSLVRQGGGGNITIPHKAAAVAGGRGDERVARIGAANVFVGDGAGGVLLGNSDVDGIGAVTAAVAPGEKSWLIVGTGGSARAAVAAAVEQGVDVAVRSRDPQRADAFMAWALSIGARQGEPDRAGLVINATPCGLHRGDPLPLDLAAAPAIRAVVDLTYRADGPTDWVIEARRRGLAAVDGREMLIQQGAAAWRWWFPDHLPPTEVMRAALEGRMD